MKIAMDYWVGQLLSLVFYVMTLIVYNRVRKIYVGGKIAAAINLIIVFLFVLLLNDFVDYFLALVVPLGADNVLILKILLKLVAIGVLFFGGLRFFSNRGARQVHDDALNMGTEDVDSDTEAFREPVPPGGTVQLPRDMTGKLPKLGRYEILEQVGKGAMGIVYKGKDPRLNRLTAIKTIRFIDEYDEQQVDRIKAQFYREAEVAAKLTHRNIVTIYDVGEDLDLSYLAMEYLEGQTLEPFTDQDRLLPVNKCVDIVRQVCAALSYAHRYGIVHRDIKPGNIMLLKNGLVKVTDFGIARAADGMRTRTGVIKGTPYYMSPEQATGKTVGGASDVFSLGVVFYQLLSGKLPFTGDNLGTIMYRTANTDPDPPTRFRPDIPGDVLAILNRALEKAPDNRYASAEAMQQDLERVSATLSGHDGNRFPVPGNAKMESTRTAERFAEVESDETPLVFSDLPKAYARKQEGRSSQAAHSDDDRFDASPSDEHSVDPERAFSDFQMMLDAGTEDVPAEKTQSGAYARDADQSTVRVAGKRAKAGEGDPESKISRSQVQAASPAPPSPFRKWLRVLAACLLLTAASAFAYSYFWSAPKADERLVKILYHRFFLDSKKDAAEMMAAQQQRVQQIIKQKMAEKQRLAQLENEKNALAEKQTEDLTGKKQEQQQRVEHIIQQQEKEPKENAKTPPAQPVPDQSPAAEQRETRAEKEAARQAAEAAAREAELKRLAAIRQAQALRSAQALETIRQQVAAADRLRQSKAYLKARQQYQMALDAIAQSEFREDERFVAQRRAIERVLQQDDMRYGPKGYIFFEERWLSPQAHANLLLDRGFVKYKGAWTPYKDLTPLIRKLTRSVPEDYLDALYAGKRVHTKNIRYQDVLLEENSEQNANFRVIYNWEVWTFNGRDQGTCNLKVQYAETDGRWRLIKGCP